MEKQSYISVTVRLTPLQLKALDHHRVTAVPPPSRQEVIRQLVEGLSAKKVAQ